MQPTCLLSSLECHNSPMQCFNFSTAATNRFPVASKLNFGSVSEPPRCTSPLLPELSPALEPILPSLEPLPMALSPSYGPGGLGVFNWPQKRKRETSQACEVSPQQFQLLLPSFAIPSGLLSPDYSARPSFAGKDDVRRADELTNLFSEESHNRLSPVFQQLLSPCIPSYSPAEVALIGAMKSPQLNTAFGLVSPASQSSAILIGDFSRPHLLPVIDNAEVKKITGETLSRTLLGGFGHQGMNVDIRIIDCRYPYEYGGGHIMDAVNIHDDDQLLTQLFKDASLHSRLRCPNNPVILIFYCEFSVKRSVDRLRNFRKHDRLENVATYPTLCFPEMYLVSGGYKKFFEMYPELCTPQAYVPMKDDRHGHDLVRFSRGKTFDGTSKKQGRPLRRFATRI